ncbi:hypothetical protein HYY75_01125 [bacterium]|nr:hypothetical protein [bacterium]
MAKIKIHDIPKDEMVSKEDLKLVLGGIIIWTSPDPYLKTGQTAWNPQKNGFVVWEDLDDFRKGFSFGESGSVVRSDSVD